MEVDDLSGPCSAYDLGAGDRWEFTYQLSNGGRELIIADDTGTTWLYKR